MASQTDDAILLRGQLSGHKDDFDHLLKVLEFPAIQQVYQGPLLGHFKRIMNPLREKLECIEKFIDLKEYTSAWSALSHIALPSRQLMEQAQEFLGSVAIRRTALHKQMMEKAQSLAEAYAKEAGVNWSPAIIIGSQSADEWAEELMVEEQPGDNLIRVPIPRWDIWYLPLIGHDYGYWVAKRGRIKTLDQFVDDQMGLAQRLIAANAPTAEEVAPFLPELREILSARGHAEDLEKFREQVGAALELCVKRQKVHLWHLVADAFATYTVGPAYAYALLFLTLDPAHAFYDGERSRNNGSYENRFVPSAAWRAAVVFQTLQEMDERTKADPDANGAYSSDLKLLKTIWEQALKSTGDWERFREVQAAMQLWQTRIYEAIETHFGWLAQETAKLWSKAKEEVVPLFQTGAETALQPEIRLIVNAAWWCRARYPERISSLSMDGARLLHGAHPPTGLHAKPLEVEEQSKRLLHSRLYDVETDLEALQGLFNSSEIQQSDRDAVAGRFYRLLSEHDYRLKRLQRLIRQGSSVSSSLAEAIRQSQGPETEALRREALDFLGGVLIRSQGLDSGICTVAEALLRDYARLTGVNWASRVVLGSNPLFSTMSDIIHLRFPDWELWNLPLMAHEFGHVTALATPAFRDLLAEELLVVAQGHPEANAWSKDQIRAYAESRSSHFHEFFADGFAVYSQGPSFAYNVVLLQFNPSEAYLPRGQHPTHAERVEVILQVLGAMNEDEKLDEFDNGPYKSVIERLRVWWSKACESGPTSAGPVYQFHRLQAKKVATKIYNLLDKYYRLGVRCQAGDWMRFEEKAHELIDGEPDLHQQSLRNLLNIAWACRVRYPDRAAQVAKRVRSAAGIFSTQK